MIRRAIDILRRRGINVLIRAVIVRIQGMFAGQSASFTTYQHLFVSKSGLEIGGPSAVFAKGGIFPVYPIVHSLDNYNYSHTTAWNNDVKPTSEFRFDSTKLSGRQHIGEATSMRTLAPNAYDFVLCSHMLEHTANPILVLNECKRILKHGAILVLALPNMKYTFDHRRPVTTLEHLISDFEANVNEEDLTHLPEILTLHDLYRDPDILDMITFQSRCENNALNRCMHHHVFDKKLTKALMEHIDMEILNLIMVAPHHILLIARYK